MSAINEKLLFSLVSRIDNPGHCLGGEFGQRSKPDAVYKTAIIFPDTYEIGMSNYSWKILYSIINDLPGISCQRVFAPPADLEQALKDAGLPLFTLEDHVPLHQLDLLGFTLGYELSATNILTILNSGGVPILRQARGSEDPLVLIGGPGTTNPLPYADFVDGAVIGEAEAVVPELYQTLSAIKTRGLDAGETRILQQQVLLEHPNIWVPGTNKKVRRAVWNGFTSLGKPLRYPVTSYKIVQEHGVVEIMRGCPQGCRFCHAGVYYRPYRQKSIEQIVEEVRDLVDHMGYRRITLSSLSSGDYSQISELITILNREFSSRGVSFQLPSLKVESFTLPIIEALSNGRKGGLTFAIETPTDFGQAVLNKQVTFTRVINILHEAERRGWKTAKFYFMIGLPIPGQEDEASAILSFLKLIRQQTRMQINVNIGTFVPKPHTPYQWAGMLDWRKAQETLHSIKTQNTDRGIKITYQGGFLSFLEGIISLGDERVGALIYEAWKAGARFDSWEDKCRKEIWKQVIAKSDWEPENLLIAQDASNTAKPWDSISMGVTKSFLQREWFASQQGKLTPRCTSHCSEHCGICSRITRVVDQAVLGPTPGMKDSLDIGSETGSREVKNKDTDRLSLVITFQKTGVGRFLPHLSLIQAFEQAFLRMDLPIWMSGAYNPKPKMDFNQALPLGMESLHEVMTVQIWGPYKEDSLRERLTHFMPQGVEVVNVSLVPTLTILGKKFPSLSTLTHKILYRVYPDGPQAMERIESAVNKLEGWSVGKKFMDHFELIELRGVPGTWGIRRLPSQEAGYRPDRLGAVLEKISTFGNNGQLIENTIEEWIAWENQQTVALSGLPTQ